MSADDSTQPGFAAIPPTHPHPGWILLAVISSVRTFILGFIAILFSTRDQGAIAIILAMIIPSLLIVAWRTLQWREIRYSAQDGSITLSSGLLDKFHRSVQVERVHSVDTTETPLGRLLGVRELQIATAGAAETITIPALSTEDAVHLRLWIDASINRNEFLDVEGESTETVPSTSSAKIVWRMGGREVMLAGLTSGRIAPALAIGAAAWRFGSDLLPGSLWDRVPVDPDRLTATSIVFLIAVAAALAWGLSIGGAVLSLWNFTLKRGPESVTVSSGLLDRTEKTISIQRIQAISIVEGVLRQPFGYASVMLEGAAKPHGSAESGDFRYLLPFIRHRDVPEFIEAALPELAWRQDAIDWTRLPSRARSRYLIPAVLDFVIVLAVASVAFAFISRVEWWYGFGLLPLLPILLVLGWLQFRDARWAVGQNHRLFMQYRTIDKRLLVASGRRVQLREISSNPLQRRAGLGTVSIRLATAGAGGYAALRHVEYVDGERLLALLSPAQYMSRPSADPAPSEPAP